MGGDFGDFTDPVAKKRHQCAHCLQDIIVGERHRKYTGVWQGDSQNWRIHSDCFEPLRECQNEDGETCPERHERGKSCIQTGVVR